VPRKKALVKSKPKLGLSVGENLKKKLGLEQCPLIQSASDVARAFGDLKTLDREVMVAGAIDSKCRLLCWNMLALGRSDLLIMRTGDAFVGAITTAAVGIFLVHNHPSGSLEPSEEDIQLTRNVAEAGVLLGYSLFDHVILSTSGYLSVLSSKALKAYTKTLSPVTEIVSSAADGGNITNWKCDRCRTSNNIRSRINGQRGYGFSPVRCNKCGTFMWLETPEPAEKFKP
jgi:hypothetical protein